MSALEPLVEAIATRVVELLRDQSSRTPSLVSQASSPLGNRRHCLAVRRRIAQDLPGASVVGREYLLTPQALEDELARLARLVRAGLDRRPSPSPQALEDELARLARGSREARRAKPGAGRLATL